MSCVRLCGLVLYLDVVTRHEEITEANAAPIHNAEPTLQYTGKEDKQPNPRQRPTHQDRDTPTYDPNLKI